MSGIASTTRSPSSLSTMPAASCAWPGAADRSSASRGSPGARTERPLRGPWVSNVGVHDGHGLTVVAGDDGEIVPLAAALQRIVFPQRVRGELLRASRMRRRSGCPVKRMPNMSHTSRSSQLAPFPERYGTLHRRVGIVDVHADGNAARWSLSLCEQVDETVAMLGVAILEVVDAGDVDEQIEAPLFEPLRARRTTGRRGTTTRVCPRYTLASRVPNRFRKTGEHVVNGWCVP